MVSVAEKIDTSLIAAYAIGVLLLAAFLAILVFWLGGWSEDVMRSSLRDAVNGALASYID